MTKKPHPSTADEHVILDNVEDFQSRTTGMLRAIGTVHLRDLGWYSCVVGDTRRLYEIRSN